MPEQSCSENWCSLENQFVLPSALIALIKNLNLSKTTVYKRDSYIEAVMSAYLTSTKFKFLAVDVKGYHGIILLNYYVKSVWAGIMTKRELLVNQMLLPSHSATKKLKGSAPSVSNVKMLFKSKELITSIDPNIPMSELNVPLLQIPPNMPALLLNYIIFDLSILPKSLMNTIQLYQNVLSNPSIYSISIKFHDRLNLKCIESLIAKHPNPVLYISGPRKLVRRLQLKFYYRNIKVLTTVSSKYLDILNTRVDWSMLHDFISLSADHLVSDEATKKEFEPFLTKQEYTVFNEC